MWTVEWTADQALEEFPGWAEEHKTQTWLSDEKLEGESDERTFKEAGVEEFQKWMCNFLLDMKAFMP